MAVRYLTVYTVRYTRSRAKSRSEKYLNRSDTMPTCPHCGKFITELDYESTDTDCGYVRLDSNEEPDYTSRYTDTDRIEYTCPECESTIAKSEHEAIEYLKLKV